MFTLAAVSGAADAQVQFDELRSERALPDHSDQTRSVALGDVDGDGDLDMVMGNLGQHRLYRNDGSNTGIFIDATAGQLPQGGGGKVVMGDVDGDGDLDLVLGDRGQIGLLLNDGTGTFTAATAGRMPGGGGGCVTLGDVDGDGDLDLVIGIHGAQNRLYVNLGAGTFTDVTATQMPGDSDPTVAVVLGDVDGDGDLDMAIGNDQVWVNLPWVGWIQVGVQNRLYLNDGAGAFADVTATRMPIDDSATVSVAFGDVDGDGDLDLVLGNFYNEFAASYQDQLYLNDGTGAFSDATAGRMPTDYCFSSAVALGDLDGDGDLDIVIGRIDPDSAHAGPLKEQNRLLLNDGAGVFTDASATRMPSDHDATLAVALGDVDGDGDLDLACGNVSAVLGASAANRLYVNDGRGTYADVTAPRMPLDNQDTRAVVFGDIDGDGDLDMVQGNVGSDGGWSSFGASYNRLLMNDGDGGYTDVTATRGPVGQYGAALSLVFGDVDGDGDLDLVVGNYRINELFLNDGRGFFSASAGLPADSDSTLGLALGDVDGDGDLDLICANGDPGSAPSVESNRLYLNDGTGVFVDATPGRMQNAPAISQAVALGDVDGDGDLDLVFGNSRSYGVSQNRLYLNDGTGTFADVTAGRMPLGNDDTRSLALGDVDGDGDLDLVTGTTNPHDRLYLNDGTGTFTEATAGHLPVGGASGVVLGDLDGDGDLDLVLAGITTQDRVYLNDGLGTFTDVSTIFLPGTSWSRTAALGDIDGDGDLDMTFAVRGQNRVYQNLLRQLSSPSLLRSGRTLVLEVFARGGAPRFVDVALPFLSTGTAALPLPPLGTVGIDPARAVALPPILIPQPGGVGSVSLAIPNVPGLVGLHVYCQAVLLQVPLEPRLTNVTVDVLSR